MIKKLFSKEAIAWAILILVMIISGLIRYRLLDVPLERDEGEYAYIGQLMLQGVAPYQDVYTMKLPGVPAAYAVIMAIFGQTCQGIHAGLLIINEITILLVFLLARRLLNSGAAAVSAMVFAVFSISQLVLGIFANAEHFVIIFVAAGLLVLLRSLDQDSLVGVWIAGVLLGIGVCMKQHGAMFIVMSVLYVAFRGIQTKPVPWRRFVYKELCLLAGVMAVTMCLCLIMLWVGVFKQFWFWTVHYAELYVSHVSLQKGLQRFIDNFLRIQMTSQLFWIMSGFGIIGLCMKSFDRDRRFLLLFTLFSFLSICPGLIFRNHYFLLLMPCAALLAGTSFYMFAGILSRFWRRKMLNYGLPVILMMGGLGIWFSGEYDYLFLMSPSDVCRAIYWPNPFVESRAIALFIAKNTNPNDTIAILGSEPQICFYAQRRSATGYIYMYPLMENHSRALQMQKDCIRQIESQKPKYVVFIAVPYSLGYSPKSNPYIMDWFENSYKHHLKLRFTIEMHADRSAISWFPDAKEKLSSDYGVFIYECSATP